MQCREGQMAGFSGHKGGFDRFQIPHLSDEDDVWILPEDVPKGSGKAFCIGVDLPLIDHAFLVAVEIFDRILDGNDMGVSLNFALTEDW